MRIIEMIKKSLENTQWLKPLILYIVTMFYSTALHAIEIYPDTFVTGFNISVNSGTNPQVTVGSSVTVHDSGTVQTVPDAFTSIPQCSETDGSIVPCTESGTTVAPISVTIESSTGVDGDLTATGTYSATSDKNYNKIAIGTGGILNLTGDIKIKTQDVFEFQGTINIDGNVEFHVGGTNNKIFKLHSNSTINFTEGSTLVIYTYEATFDSNPTFGASAARDFIVLAKNKISSSSSVKLVGYYYSENEIALGSGVTMCGALAAEEKISVQSNSDIISGKYFTGTTNTAAQDLLTHMGKSYIDCLVRPACGVSVALAENEWIQISRPCGTSTHPTFSEIFANATNLGTYGDNNNWIVWKADGTNNGNIDKYIMITDPDTTMKLGLGYWFQTNNANVSWDNSNDNNKTWSISTEGTVTPASLGITDAEVKAFFVVNPITDTGIGNIQNNQDVLLGNPFPVDIHMEDIYVSDDNGSTYTLLSSDPSYMSSTAYITDITEPEAQPYQAVTPGTPGVGHNIPPKEGAWFYMKDGNASYENIRIAFPLEK